MIFRDATSHRILKNVIHWFRRDLRLTDNTALHAAATAGAQVIPVYILSEWKKNHRWTGPNRQHFLCGSLRSLDAKTRIRNPSRGDFFQS